MATVFKSAMNHIHADEKLKAKTKVYLIENSSVSAGGNRPKSKNPLFRHAIAAACALLCLCTVTAGAVAYYKTPTSYLSLDIDDGVELGVNPFEKVVSVVTYDSGGKNTLNEQCLINTDVTNAIHSLVENAAREGGVAKDGSTVIAIASETDSSSTAAALESAAAQGVDSAIKSSGMTATVQKDNVSLQKRVEAQKLNITPGKLDLIQKLQVLDPSITVSQYKNSKVADIMKKYSELKKDSHNQKDGNGSINPPDQAEGTGDGAQSVSGAAPEDPQTASGAEGDVVPPASSGESSRPVSGKPRSGSSESSRSGSKSGTPERTASGVSSRPPESSAADAGE